MNRITENAIEEFAIELLQKLGYQYMYSPEIAPDTDRPDRNGYEEVVLSRRINAPASEGDRLGISRGLMESNMKKIKQIIGVSACLKFNWFVN